MQHKILATWSHNSSNSSHLFRSCEEKETIERLVHTLLLVHLMGHLWGIRNLQTFKSPMIEVCSFHASPSHSVFSDMLKCQATAQSSIQATQATKQQNSSSVLKKYGLN